MSKKAYHTSVCLLKQQNRVPIWADLQKIKDFYLSCPKGYVVDHILPLNGKFVSGLHVLENLQYLTPNENSKKRNFFGEHQANSKELNNKKYKTFYCKNRERLKAASLNRYYKNKTKTKETQCRLNIE